MQVRLKIPYRLHNATRAAGEIVDIPQSIAFGMIRQKFAETVEEKPAPKGKAEHETTPKNAVGSKRETHATKSKSR